MERKKGDQLERAGHGEEVATAMAGGRSGIPAHGRHRPVEMAQEHQGARANTAQALGGRETARDGLATMRCLRQPWRTAATGTGVEGDFVQ